MTTLNEKKIFDDFPKVDCNECGHYWTSACDGVKPTVNGSEKRCTSFIATRSVIIPAQIDALKTRLKWLYGAVILQGLCFIILCLSLMN